jgi:Restriction endonuclease
MPSPLLRFGTAAAELRQQELARLSDAVVPRLEAMRVMTPPAFREVVALMLYRFGHDVMTDPTAPNLISTKNGAKFITECASPIDLAPTKIPALRRLHDTVIAANAQRGFYITTRTFTAEAEQYADAAPLDLIDGARLVRALNQSRKHVLLPQTYNAMCGECGGIVQHRLSDDEAKPCGSGHMVAPTINRAMLIPPRPAPAPAAAAGQQPRHSPRQKVYASGKAKVRAHRRAHNRQVHANAIKQQQHTGQ